jgi:ElaB/YqjD/DUF883 family membrane-anchored ribosome-binding protein
MTTSRKATRASGSNYLESSKATDKKYNAEVRSVIAKYEDRGTSGSKQMVKELAALKAKYNKDLDNRVEKGKQDDDNIIRYGKDAMKGKSFAKYNKGGMAKKKMGYSKGGMCGASNPAARPMKKGK